MWFYELAALCLTGIAVLMLIYAVGSVFAATTADEERSEDWLDGPEVLVCLACDFRYESTPVKAAPLYCPRCGLPLVNRED